MRLYTSPTSPYARKVHVVLRETNQFDDVEMAPVMGTPLDPGSMPRTLNPLGKLPALELDNGTAIFDSRVICRYLDDRAKSGLYGTGDRMWELLTLEAVADGILDAALLMTYEARLRPEEKQFPDWVEGQWAKISTAIAALDTKWIDDLPSDFQHIGQIAVGCALGYVDFRHGQRNWREGHPKLAEWYAQFCERDSMKATVPVG